MSPLRIGRAAQAVGAKSIFVASDKRLSPEMEAMFLRHGPIASLEYGLNENNGTPPRPAMALLRTLALLAMAFGL